MRSVQPFGSDRRDPCARGEGRSALSWRKLARLFAAKARSERKRERDWTKNHRGVCRIRAPAAPPPETQRRAGETHGAAGKRESICACGTCTCPVDVLFVVLFTAYSAACYGQR